MTKGKRKGPGKDNTSAESVATKERHAEWIEQRRKGWTYRQIADHHGVSVSSVHEAIAKYLHETVAEPAAELRKLEIERLDGLLKEVNARIDSPFTGENGDDKLKAIDTALSIGAQRAKLLGLNAAVKVQDVTPPRDDMWARVRAWLLDPSPELQAVLTETGWERRKTA
jgi:hypothetical protein